MDKKCFIIRAKTKFSQEILRVCIELYQHSYCEIRASVQIPYYNISLKVDLFKKKITSSQSLEKKGMSGGVGGVCLMGGVRGGSDYGVSVQGVYLPSSQAYNSILNEQPPWVHFTKTICISVASTGSLKQFVTIALAFVDDAPLFPLNTLKNVRVKLVC